MLSVSPLEMETSLDDVRADVRGGIRRGRVRQSLRGNRSPSLLAAFTANVVCPIVMSADTNQIPRNQVPITANWAPLHNPRSKRRAAQENTDSPSSKKRQLGRAKMKRDRIMQEISDNTEANSKLKAMLRKVEKRISELQDAAVQRPTAKQVNTYYCI